MKVLHVSHSIANSYGGPTQSLKGFARAAGLSGAEVSIAAPACSAADSAGLDTVVNHMHEFPAVGTGAFTVSPPLMSWLNRNARKYDVVHVHGLFNPISSFGARSCIRQGVPTIIRPFGTLSAYTFTHRRQAMKRIWFDLIERQNLERAAAIHFTTLAEQDEASRHGIDFSGRAHVIAPAFDVERTAATGEQRRDNIVAFLSRLHPVKNLEALIEAWSIVASVRQDWRLVIAGSGAPDYEQSLHRLAAEKCRPGSFEFTGFLSRDNKEQLLERARLFVLPSRHENFGMAVLEAIAAGIPVIVTPEVQLAPFVAEHSLGIVSSADPRDLAEAIIRGMDDTSLRERTQHIGLDLARNYFGPEAVGVHLMQMYASAMATSLS